ncbi:VaFE repeat-containing surface-anchored protein [Corynebacterium tuberculostearicum]|uniref:VaFE repeat-containing surface-anchored protein n=1 Tax=Corynebacterium tuberculostearicum TaxID=38304 RepID=UPI0038D018EF
MKVEKQPADAFITVVHPNGSEDKSIQTVMPVDQPGLPDEDGGSGSNPSTMTPSISTTVDQLGEHEALKAGTVVTDHVHYEGLVPNKEYILNAELRNKTDESVIGESKEPVKFTPKSSEGDVDVKITVNEGVEAGSVDQGVAFEYLTSTAVDKSGKDSESGDENKIAEHTDINDGKQTVDSHEELKPKISTTVDQLGEHEALKAGTVVTDHVHYEGLVPNKEYILNAELRNKTDESVIGESKEPVKFTPKSSEGDVDVKITVNEGVEAGSVDQGVAFEYLTSTAVDKSGKDSESGDENKIAEHTDINDGKQTVDSHEELKPKISTTVDQLGEHEALKAGTVVTDHVHYEGLVPNKEYILNAELRNKTDESVIGESKEPVKFTPKSSEGDVDVKITVNEGVEAGSVDQGVAFEYLTSTAVDKSGKDSESGDENKIAEHTDINDGKQTVDSHEELKPKISTTVDQLGEHEALKAGTVVTDHVHYEGLVPNKEYILNAELRNKTDESVIGESKEPVKFTPKSSEGDVDVKITVNEGVEAGSVDQGVAFEYLTSTAVDKSGKDSESGDENKIAEHTDINDGKQTVDSHEELKPKISTTVDQLGEHEALKAGTVVTDHVHYEGLVPNKEYILNAELRNKTDESVIGESKEPVKFTPKSSEGDVDVKITVNEGVEAGSVDQGVAFEYLTSTAVDKSGKDSESGDENKIAEHTDINDGKQTVDSHEELKPKISTTVDQLGEHEALKAGTVVTDHVHYEGLVPNKEYILNAELRNKTDESVIGESKEPVKFTPKSSEGDVDVKITVNEGVEAGSVDQGVAFEYLTSTAVDKSGKDSESGDENKIAEHTDINDGKQTVDSHEELKPKISTTVDQLGEHEALKAGTVVTDHVHYEGLVPNKEYILNAELRNKTDESVIGESKEPVKFTPKSSEGDVDVKITVNEGVEAGSVDQGVAFEYLTSTAVDKSGKDSESGDENKIAEHTDINDGKQTVDSHEELKPKISTTVDQLGEHEALKAGTVVTDHVHYEGLVPNKEYILNAELRNKTDESVIGESKEPVKFTPKSSEGDVDVKITVNEGVEAGSVDQGVAFEYLTSTAVDKSGKDSESGDENKIAEHTDINDGKQTVDSHEELKPKISTTVDQLGEHEALKAGTVVTDHVHYEGLVPNKEYILNAELRNKTDESVIGESKEPVKFTPKSSEGDVDVKITVNEGVEAGSVDQGVAFEYLTSTAVDKSGKDSESGDENKIAEHTDINDGKQTVDSHEELKPKISTTVDQLGEHEALKAGTVVTDHVHYEGLVPNKEYILNAELRNKTDESVIGESKEPVKFTPKSSEGDVDVKITVNEGVEAGSVDQGVAFEYLTSTAVDKSGKDSESGDENKIAEHTDINDGKQTVDSHEELKPKISTTVDQLGEHEALKAGTVVTDHVHYEGLVPNKEYILNAELRNKTDESVIGESKEPVKFTPKSSEGDVDVKITVNEGVEAGSVDQGVAFEYLTSTAVDKSGKDSESGDENKIAEHTDINDGKQTVDSHEELKPKISTTVDQLGEHEALKAGTVVTDHVHYEGLVPNKEYILNAELRNKTDESVIGESKEPVKFTPKSSEGDVDVKITVNEGVEAGSVDQGVAFEYLTSTAVDKSGKDSESGDENKIAEHTDINDGKQTVDSHEELKPKISTTVDQLGEHEALKAGTVVTDHVHYEGLVPNKEYILNAELRNKTDESVIGESKEPVKFTPKSSEGDVDVKITVNEGVEAGSVDQGVAFEYLTSTAVDKSGKDSESGDENKIAEHTDINDGKQTVDSHEELKPKISTTVDQLGEHEALKAGTVVTDHVHYEGLVPNKEYILNAELRNKTDESVIGESKEPVKFTPKSSEGDVDVKITVNEGVEAGSVDQGVAFEYLTSTAVDKSGKDSESGDENKIAEHTDINDGKQTVDSHEELKPSESQTPTTTTTGVVPGNGGNGETSKPSEPSSEQSSSEDSSTPTTSETCESEEPGDSESEQPSESEEPSESESGEPSESESESVETTSSEASETSESDEPSDCGSTTPEKPGEPSESTEPNEPGTPGDNDEKDTPKVSTNADFEGGLREVVAGAKVVDQVSYEGLVPGKEYTLDAQLISKADGKTVLGETKGHKFTPKSANGTEAVTIVVDEKVTEPVEAAVAFETLTSTQVDKHGEDNPTDEDNPNPVGEHKDINDDDQTVTSEDFEKTPKITTNADFEKGSHAVVAGAKIVDEVTYEGLVPGKEYTLKAELISKEDGKTVLGKGEKTFTPEKSKGMEPVTITVNDDVTEPVKAAVAFEELTSVEVNDKGEETPGTTSENPNHIADHKDINDKDQTVTSDKKGGKTPWWLILIPGIGLGKIIKDHFDHKDHGNHNGGHGDNNHQPGNQDAPEGGNSGHGNGNGDAPGQAPEEVGNALPSDAQRVDIKSVPSGATELEPGMQSYVK